MWVFELLEAIWDGFSGSSYDKRDIYEVYVDKVNMKTHKFERFTIEGRVRDNPDGNHMPKRQEKPYEIIDRLKEKHFGNRDRYVRAYSKNIRIFTAYNHNDIDSYSYIFYDRYENTVIGLSFGKIH